MIKNCDIIELGIINTRNRIFMFKKQLFTHFIKYGNLLLVCVKII